MSVARCRVGLMPRPRRSGRKAFRFPPVKVFEKGERRRDVLGSAEGKQPALPDIAIADINAMIGACKIGEERIRAVVR